MNFFTQSVVLVCSLVISACGITNRSHANSARSHTTIEQTFYSRGKPKHWKITQNNNHQSGNLRKELQNFDRGKYNQWRPSGLNFGDSIQDVKKSFQFLSHEFHDHQNLPSGLEHFGSAEEKITYACLILGLCNSAHSGFQPPPPSSLDIVFQWKNLEFAYSNDRYRETDIKSGFFNPNVSAPIDMDVHYSAKGPNKLFVTIPRFQLGTPATLGLVTNRLYKDNPVIEPFPDWSWHRNPTDCNYNRLISVYRIKIDSCGRLWVIDTGKYGSKQTCPPQLLAFDLTDNNKVVVRYEIPKNLIEDRSIIVTPIVDVRETCGDAFVYLADCQTYSILVYNLKENKAWQVTDKTMYPYPNYGTYSIQGDSFDLMDGVLGMDLEPYKRGNDRKLFYHAMSSPTENWVYTSYLRNESLFSADPASSPQIFHVLNGSRNTQSCAMGIDSEGTSFFGLMSPTSLNCWNTQNANYGDKIQLVVRDVVTLQFASGVKVIPNLNKQEELWVLTSRFQKIATGTLNTKEFNFRILAKKIKDIKPNACKNYADFGFPNN